MHVAERSLFTTYDNVRWSYDPKSPDKDADTDAYTDTHTDAYTGIATEPDTDNDEILKA